jgi:hypothetical protein
MRRLILTVLVISNIGAGIEIAADYDDVWAEVGISFANADQLHSGHFDDGDGLDKDADCDHCCHSSAHFSGAVFSLPTLPFMHNSSGVALSYTSHSYAGASPPTPPPNA